MLVLHSMEPRLVKLIQSIFAENEHFLKSLSPFVSKSSTWNISPDEIQVSYDVVALYPSVLKKQSHQCIGRHYKQQI